MLRYIITTWDSEAFSGLECFFVNDSVNEKNRQDTHTQHIPAVAVKNSQEFRRKMVCTVSVLFPSQMTKLQLQPTDHTLGMFFAFTAADFFRFDVVFFMLARPFSRPPSGFGRATRPRKPAMKNTAFSIKIPIFHKN